MIRQAIPVDVKRQLRQEAGFGCCFCGHPFFEYHHIIPYAEDSHNRPQDMMAVCPNHHYECTVNSISVNDQRSHKENPKNKKDGFARGVLAVNAQKLVVNIGGGKAINTPNLLDVGPMHSPVNLLKAEMSEEGRVEISSLIHDSKGKEIARLVKNEWMISITEVWDFECRPLQAKVRKSKGNIAFYVDCRNDQVSLEGEWFHQGTQIKFSPSMVLFGSNSLGASVVENCGGFLHVG